MSNPNNKYVLTTWNPEDASFWQRTGKAIANKNLWISIPALLLAFAIWQVWSVTVSELPKAGFNYTATQLFWLAALPGLSGGTLRIFYSFMVPIFGGRRWTALTTASLLIPAIGIGFAVQNPETPYWVMVALSLLCGFGGGNFSSSMANISFFYPKSEKGKAMGLNAGIGNLGVSVVQLVVPLVIATSVFGWLGGNPQTITQANGATSSIWLQNGAFVFVPFIIICTIASWFGMNDIADAKASFADQAIIFKRKDNWLMCVLYMGTFGSFIGFAAAFPLLMKVTFPEVNVLNYVFLGPLISALARAGSGGLSDRVGGGRVTLISFIIMMAALLAALYFVANPENPIAFGGFFTSFMVLFFATGVGNASTFQMIPAIMSRVIDNTMANATTEQKRHQTERESAAITGFTAAIAAYAFFIIPISFNASKLYYGGPQAALFGFLIFYLICLFITWFCYTRKGAILHIEGQRAKRIQSTGDQNK